MKVQLNLLRLVFVYYVSDQRAVSEALLSRIFGRGDAFTQNSIRVIEVAIMLVYVLSPETAE